MPATAALVDAHPRASALLSFSGERSVTTSVVLPAFDEENGITVVLARLRAVLDVTCEVIVVDDGSHDGTALAAELAGARVYRHEVNRGKGAAMLTGISGARGSKIIFMDADDTYPVDVIPAIIEALDAVDIVLTSRAHGRANISPFNRFGNAVFRRIIAAAAGGPVQDPLSGLYGVHLRHLEAMALSSQRFTVEAEIVIKALRMGLTVHQQPIEYRQRIGRSKLSPVRDGWAIGRTSLGVWRSTRKRGWAPAAGPLADSSSGLRSPT